MRVGTYNINEGGRDRLAEITRVMGDLHPDACALLEANDRAGASTLARSLDMQLIYGESNSPFHVAWLTRQPPIAVHNHKLPVLQKTLLEIVLVFEGREVSVFAAHLTGGRELGEAATNVRVREIRGILDLLRSVNRPHLLVGDLNSLHPDDTMDDRPADVPPRGDALPGAPRAVIRSILQAGYTDCFRALHTHDPGYTYPNDHPWLRLDYIFASPDMAPLLEACNVIDTPQTRAASDHLPVIAVFHTALGAARPHSY